MRSMRNFVVVACALAAAGATAWACGGSTIQSSNGDDGGGNMDATATDTGAGDSASGDGRAGDGGTTSDSGSTEGGSVGPVHCGMATCQPPQVCCVDIMMRSESCTDPNACMGVPVTCSDTASCPMGDVCCGSLVNMMPMVACTPGSCPMGEVELCQMSSECPMGYRCRPFFGGVRICVPPMDGGMGDGGIGGDASMIDSGVIDAGAD